MSMRVSDNYLASILVSNTNRSLSRVVRWQQMASSLRRVNSFADDPIAVGAINRYRGMIETNAQYLRNSERASTFLTATDAALIGVGDILTEARLIAMRESSALASPTTQEQAAGEVDSLINQLMDRLNATVEGDYIFGGHRTSTIPFQRQGDIIYYQGDTGVREVQIGPQATLPVNIAGSAFMGAGSSTLTGNVDLAPSLQTDDLLSDLNLGSGWDEGAFTIVDGSGMTFDVDLTGATTVADVIARIDTATAGAVVASFNPSENGLQLTGTGPLTVSDVDDGRTAQSLGLIGSTSGDLIIGGDIRVAPTWNTPLADIPSLHDSLPLGQIHIEQAGTGYDIHLFATATLGDIQNLLQTVVPGMEVTLQGGVLALVSSSTEPFTVTSSDASSTASLLGIDGTGTPSRLFGVLADLKAALEDHDPDAIRSRLSELESVRKMVLAQTIRLGGWENRLEWMTDLLRQRDENLRASLSQEWDADVAQVATELSKAQSAYEASLLVTSRLFEVNLMDYLR